MAERRQVSWRARGDDSTIDHDSLVHPRRSRVDEVVFDCGEASAAVSIAHGAASLRISRRTEHPRAVADGGHRLVHGEHAHDEVEHRHAPPHVIRTEAARDHKRFEFVGRNGRDRRVRQDGVAEFSRVLGAGRSGPYHGDGGALLLKPLLRVGHFEVLEAIVAEESDLRTHQPLRKARRRHCQRLTPDAAEAASRSWSARARPESLSARVSRARSAA
mmetsp:Transcript_14948/g.34792  ORF Transcript_14948/g.34792 Transcript_14948/m.34792 type:complete len:217 (-) Transcript_14948:34-684(-)